MRLSGLAGALSQAIYWRILTRAMMVLALPILLAVITGNDLWLTASIATICLFIAMEHTKLAPLGVMLHGLVVAAGFLALLVAINRPILFVLGCVLLANVSIQLTRYGEKLRSLGNFTFIPALYLACEIAETVHQSKLATGSHMPTSLLANGLAFLPFIAIALLPVLALACINVWQAVPAAHGRIKHFGRVRHTADLGLPAPYWKATIAVTLAVAIAAFCVEWLQFDHGQWVIWSAASVVTGDLVSARKKLGDRIAGALLGVPLGIVLGLIVPHSMVLYDLAALAAALTLVAFRNYRLAFGSRCALIAFAIMVAGQSAAVATERVINVLLGGLISIGFVILVEVMDGIRIRTYK